MKILFNSHGRDHFDLRRTFSTKVLIVSKHLCIPWFPLLCGSASSIAQFITNTTWFFILLPPSYSIGKIKTTTSSTILPTKVYNCRTWHHSYSTPSCHEWDFLAILAPVSTTSQVFHAIEEDKGVLVFTPVQVSAWCGGNYLESNFYQHAIFFGHCCFHVSPNLTFGEVVSLFGWCLWWWWRSWRRRQWWYWWPCKESFSSQPHCAGNPEIEKSLLKIHLWNFCHN